MVHLTKRDLSLPCDLLSALLTHEKSSPDVQDFASKIGFRSIVLDLKGQVMNAKEVHNDLRATLGPKVPGSSTVPRWSREAQLDQFFETVVHFTEEAETDEIDEAILSALEVQPFGSMCDIARLARLACSTVNCHLTRSLGFEVRHLRWIAHVLTEQQRKIRVSNSEQLLIFLQEQHGCSWRAFMALDKFWFCSRTDHERIWLTRGRTSRDREGHMIQSPKLMLAIVWGVLGFMPSSSC
jgi:hypothetical protein